MKKIVLGIPKGSLTNSTVDLFDKAGYSIALDSRSYFPQINDPEIEVVLVRSQEMARYVEKGVLDFAVTGKDWILENEADVEFIADLVYGKQGYEPVRWVVAVPENSPVQSVSDLNGKKIATELVRVTQNYLRSKNVVAEVEFSWGATEVKAPKLVDAIVELTETGLSLKANQLRIIDTVVESTTQLIANKSSYKETFKKEKIDTVAMLLKGSLKAKFKVGLKMNLLKSNVEQILEVSRGLKVATVAPLVDEEWCAIDVIMDRFMVRKIIPELIKLGARDIVEYPLNKVIVF